MESNNNNKYSNRKAKSDNLIKLKNTIDKSKLEFIFQIGVNANKTHVNLSSIDDYVT